MHQELPDRMADGYVQAHLAGIAIELIESTASCDPKAVIPVFKCRSDVIVAQAPWVVRVVLVYGRFPCDRVQPEETGAGSEPHLAVAVLIDVEHNHVADVKVRRAEVIVSEGFISRIKPVERLVRPDPQETRAVLEQGVDVVPAKAVGAGRVMREYFEPVTIVAVEPILRAEPDKARVVLSHLLNACL